MIRLVSLLTSATRTGSWWATRLRALRSSSRPWVNLAALGTGGVEGSEMWGPDQVRVPRAGQEDPESECQLGEQLAWRRCGSAGVPARSAQFPVCAGVTASHRGEQCREGGLVGPVRVTRLDCGHERPVVEVAQSDFEVCEVVQQRRIEPGVPFVQVKSASAVVSGELQVRLESIEAHHCSTEGPWPGGPGGVVIR